MSDPKGNYTRLCERLAPYSTPMPMPESSCLQVLNHLDRFDSMVELGILEYYKVYVNQEDADGNPVIHVTFKPVIPDREQEITLRE